MRALSLIVPLVAVVAITACGRHRAEAAGNHPSFTLSSGNDTIKVEITTMAEQEKELVLAMRLSNHGSQAVAFRNPESQRLDGFKIAADGREAIGCDAGRFERTGSPAARLKQLPPGTDSEIEIKWAFDPRLAHDTYPWTLTVSNMYVGEQKLGDIVLTYRPGTK